MHLEGLDGEQITRQDDPNILTWTRHVSPYKSLPKLNSHLHLKYVIYDAGQKLSLKPFTLHTKLLDEFPIFEKIEKLHHAWTRSIPKTAAKDKTYNVPGVIAET